LVAAALAELGNAEACLILTENHAAEIAPLAIERLVERFGDDAAIRAALLARGDLPAATRQNLVTKVSETIAGFVVGRSWLEADRARRVTREACDKATVTIAAESPKAELPPLIRYLCGSGQLTAGLMLRALLSGNLALFEEGLAELSGMPVRRVGGLVRDRFGAGLPALLKKAQLPPSTHVAFKEALAAMRDGFARDTEDTARLQRRMIERVLTRYEDSDVGEVASLLTLLRRFATEAARDEARLYCQELVCDELVGDELAAEPPAITYSAAA
jgi:uncharacterized protein (DUF2336 family)